MSSSYFYLLKTEICLWCLNLNCCTGSYVFFKFATSTRYIDHKLQNPHILFFSLSQSTNNKPLFVAISVTICSIYCIIWTQKVVSVKKPTKTLVQIPIRSWLTARPEWVMRASQVRTWAPTFLFTLLAYSFSSVFYSVHLFSAHI